MAELTDDWMRNFENSVSYLDRIVGELDADDRLTTTVTIIKKEYLQALAGLVPVEERLRSLLQEVHYKDNEFALIRSHLEALIPIYEALNMVFGEEN